MGVLPRSAENTCKEALRDLVAERDRCLDRSIGHWMAAAHDFAASRECDRLINELLDRLSAVRR